jgi:hypothetical protein
MTIPVTATYVGIDGTPATGVVTFLPTQIVIADGEVILPAPIQFTLDGTGTFTGSVPATDDPHVTPGGWAYMIVENLTPSSRSPYLIFVPSATSGTLNLAAAVPLVQPPDLVGTQGPPNVLAIGTVTTLAYTDPATATITGSSPTQVLNLGIPQGIPGDGGGGSGAVWGQITGNIGDQTDLFTVLTELEGQISTKIDVSQYGLPGAILYATAPDTVTYVVPGAANQVLTLGSDGITPSWETPTGGEAAWGSITGSIANQTDLVTVLNNLAAEIAGNVPLSDYTAAGTILVGSSSGAVSPLTVGSNGQVLTASGGFPVWANASGGSAAWGSITGTLSAQSDLNTALNAKMTNPMTAGGDVIYGGTSGAPTRLANGSAGQVLASQGTTLAPHWITPFANPMTAGGDIIYGGTSGAPTRLANGTAGQVLKSNGTTLAPSWVTPFANPMSTAGDLILGGAAGVAARLGIGTAGQVLTVVGGTAAWATASGGGGSAYVVTSFTGTAPSATASTGVLLIGDSATDAATGANAYNIVIGANSSQNASGSTHSVAIGYNASTESSSQVAIGDSASLGNAGFGSVAIGTSASVGNSSQYATAVGGSTSCNGTWTVALGYAAVAAATSSIAIGKSADAEPLFGIAIGANASVGTGHTASVAIGENVFTTAANQFAIGTSSQQTTIIGVAAGVNPTDAANVSQITPLTSISATPTRIGLFAVVSGVGYMSTGTSSTSDWKQITN